jgi:transposase
MEGSIIWVGIDAHKKTLVVSVLGPQGHHEQFSLANTAQDIAKFGRRLTRRPGVAEVRACYEAGTCGYTLQRRLQAVGVHCDVIAPSLIPRKPGERIKTDRRDALKLAELYRAGVLTTVAPPTPEQEAVRDLCRCREDVREDLGRCRHRLIKMLVRRGLVFNSTSKLWSKAHRSWLQSLEFESDVDRVVIAEYRMAIEQAERRLAAMDNQIEQAAQLPLYRDHIAWLRCFRGIDTTVAMIFISELHGVDRFDSPRALAAYLGLVPTMHASGDSTHRGRITKTGNGNVRRALVQASWQYRHLASVGPGLRARRQGQPEAVLTIADEANRRLTSRYRRLIARGKNPNKVVIAIARELVGFLWAALCRERDVQRSAQVVRVKASATPRLQPRLRKATPDSPTPSSRTRADQRCQARKEKCAG